jgi:surfactin synthase thioesterase subunit
MTQPDDNRLWIRRFHPAAKRDTRLVFLPHAGGSASFFAPFSAALADRADVLCIQYPGRQDRWAEPCIDNIPALADAIFAVLRPLADRPLVLFGHSMGATVAFEVARRLEHDAGIVPDRLLVSGRRAPADNRDAGIHRLDDDHLVAELHRLSGTDTAILADPELLRLVLPALRGDYRAAETYVYQPGPPLRCPIVALVGDSDQRVSIDEARAWGEYSTGPFDLKVFPGGHFYLANERPAVIEAISSGRLGRHAA